MNNRNYISTLISEIPPLIQKRANSEITSLISTIKADIISVSKTLNINNFAIISVGSVVTNEFVITNEGTYFSDLDLIYIFAPQSTAQADKVKRTIQSYTKGLKQEIEVDIKSITWNRFNKLYKNGYLISFRNCIIHKTELFPALIKLDYTDSFSQVWQNILLLTPPIQSNVSVVFRSNIKLLKRYIEHKNCKFWSETTSIKDLLEYSELSQHKKEKIYLFLKLENDLFITQEKTLELFNFLRDLIYEDLQLLVSNISQSKFHPLELYIYRTYIDLIFNKSPKNIKEIILFIEGEVQNIPSNKQKLNLKQEDSYSETINKITDYFWTFVTDLKENISSITYNANKAKITIQISNFEINSIPPSLTVLIKDYSNQIKMIDIQALTQVYDATKLIKNLIHLKVPIKVEGCVYSKEVAKYTWLYEK
jgi:hypothetical protein